MTDIKTQIETDIKANKVLLYMKGNKMAPMCGFSGQVVHVLNECGIDYDIRDILLDEEKLIKEMKSIDLTQDDFIEVTNKNIDSLLEDEYHDDYCTDENFQLSG